MGVDVQGDGLAWVWVGRWVLQCAVRVFWACLGAQMCCVGAWALRELIGWPSKYRNEGAALGVQWPKGVLLHGPPGCGKTLLVRTVVGECADLACAHNIYCMVGEGKDHGCHSWPRKGKAAQRSIQAGPTGCLFRFNISPGPPAFVGHQATHCTTQFQVISDSFMGYVFWAAVRLCGARRCVNVKACILRSSALLEAWLLRSAVRSPPYSLQVFALSKGSIMASLSYYNTALSCVYLGSGLKSMC
eukprot:scaffold170466_cov23-Tisochrysis_lutea.AAC.1